MILMKHRDGCIEIFGWRQLERSFYTYFESGPFVTTRSWPSSPPSTRHASELGTVDTGYICFHMFSLFLSQKTLEYWTQSKTRRRAVMPVSSWQGQQRPSVVHFWLPSYILDAENRRYWNTLRYISMWALYIALHSGYMRRVYVMLRTRSYTFFV